MTCPSPAATFTAEVAVVFVAAANPLAGGAPSWRRRAYRADAKRSCPHDLA